MPKAKDIMNFTYCQLVKTSQKRQHRYHQQTSQLEIAFATAPATPQNLDDLCCALPQLQYRVTAWVFRWYARDSTAL
jgi:hypothetical protein